MCLEIHIVKEWLTISQCGLFHIGIRVLLPWATLVRYLAERRVEIITIRHLPALSLSRLLLYHIHRPIHIQLTSF